MKSINEFFKDEDLEIGKILVLNSANKLNLLEIKNLIKANHIEEVKYDSIEQFSKEPNTFAVLIHRIFFYTLDIVQNGNIKI